MCYCSGDTPARPACLLPLFSTVLLYWLIFSFILSFLHYVHDACGFKINKIKLSLVFLLLFEPEASNLALLFIRSDLLLGLLWTRSEYGLPVGFDRNGVISACNAVTSVWWSRKHVAFYNAGLLAYPKPFALSLGGSTKSMSLQSQAVSP